MKIARFEEIEAWQLARELTRKIYGLTGKDRFAKDFGLKKQIQSPAGSSMHNIAEGFDSETNARASFMWLWIKNTYPEPGTLNPEPGTSKRSGQKCRLDKGIV